MSLLWYNRLYISKNCKEKSYRRAVRLDAGKYVHGLYLLTLPANPANLMDIYPADVFVQRYFKCHEFQVIGIAGDKDEAFRMTGELVLEVYRATGEIRVDRYVAKNFWKLPEYDDCRKI